MGFFRRPGWQVAGASQDAWFLACVIPHTHQTTVEGKYKNRYDVTLLNGVTPKSERYERSFLIKKVEDNIIQPDSFVYNPMNLTIGAVAKHKEKKVVSVSGYYNVFQTM
ncbi:hypothetical protein [Terrilactibacillus laevilacticus]|nr:hypothetical protein [Terrilactibacillus laevilacticus]